MSKKLPPDKMTPGKMPRKNMPGRLTTTLLVLAIALAPAAPEASSKQMATVIPARQTKQEAAKTSSSILGMRLHVLTNSSPARQPRQLSLPEQGSSCSIITDSLRSPVNRWQPLAFGEATDSAAALLNLAEAAQRARLFPTGHKVASVARESRPPGKRQDNPRAGPALFLL